MGKEKTNYFGPNYSFTIVKKLTEDIALYIILKHLFTLFDCTFFTMLIIYIINNLNIRFPYPCYQNENLILKKYQYIDTNLIVHSIKSFKMNNPLVKFEIES